MSTPRSRRNILFIFPLFFALAAGMRTYAADENCREPPAGSGITVLTPRGCVPFRIGDTLVITWELQEVRTGLTFSFSPDNGASMYVLSGMNPSDPGYAQRRFTWVIPDTISNLDGSDPLSTVSDSCIVEVAEYMVNGYYGISNPFSIQQATRIGTPGIQGLELSNLHRSSREKTFTAAGRKVKTGPGKDLRKRMILSF